VGIHEGMHNDKLNLLRSMLIDHMADLSAFNYVRILPFGQDTLDWTNPDTGEIYPATFDYMSWIRGTRKSDDVDFAVKITLHHEDVDGREAEQLSSFLKLVLRNACLMLAEYSDCSCKVGAPCKRHARKEVTYADSK